MSKFSRVSANRDQSTYKTVLVGMGGVGKTFFASTIAAEDGRPVFLYAVEEGGKGVSPNHSPKHFDGARPGTYALPDTFDELIEGMRMFRDVQNAPQPPPGWLERAGAHQPILQQVLNYYPGALSAGEIAEKAKVPAQEIVPIMRLLMEAGLVRQTEKHVSIRGQKQQTQLVSAYMAAADQSWQRPHVHFVVDSTSGVERLIHEEIMRRDGVSAMTDKDYGVLWGKALPLWEQFLKELDAIRATNVHVWVIAHATEVTDASQNDGKFFRRMDIQLRGSGKVLDEARSVIRNWADNVYFMINIVEVKDGSKKARARGSFVGRRLITQYTGTCMAKTRPQVPAELPASWEDLRRAWKAGVPARCETILAKIERLLTQLRELNPQQAEEIENLRDAARNNASRLGEVHSRLQGLVHLAMEEQNEITGAVDEEEDDEETDSAEQPRPPSTPSAVVHPDHAPATL